MKQETRNKIGLLLFIFLFLLGGCLIVLYVFLGHSWNFAATEIDDASGNMDEYMVVLYEGTTDPAVLAAKEITAAKEKAATVPDRSALASQGEGSNAAATSTTEGSSVAAAGQSGFEDASSNVSGSSGSASKAITGVGSNIKKFFSLLTGSGVGDEVSNEDVSQEEGEDSVLTLDVPKGLDMGDAFATYIQKGADVLPLYTRHPEHYADGDIFYKGSHIVGVIGLTEPEPYTEVQKKIDKLTERGATTVIAIVSRECLLAAVKDVDIVIVTQGSTDTLKASTSSHRLVVESSLVGTIDAIIFSPNHIVSTKVL